MTYTEAMRAERRFRIAAEVGSRSCAVNPSPVYLAHGAAALRGWSALPDGGRKRYAATMMLED